MIDAILLDLDDTLCNTTESDNACLEAVSRCLRERYPDVDLDRVRQAHRATRRAYSEQIKREGAPYAHVTVARRMLEALGLPDDGLAEEMVEVFLHVQRKTLQATPGAIETLFRLRPALKLAVVTNGPATTQRAKLKMLQLEDLFDHVAISAELGLWKPEPGIFETTLEALDVSPEAAVMVGDIPSLDLAAPAKLGMTTVHFTGHVHIPDPDGIAALRLEKFPDLPRLLGL